VGWKRRRLTQGSALSQNRLQIIRRLRRSEKALETAAGILEVFHAEALEEVTPKIVEGFLDVGRDRRLGKIKGDGSA
jgi:hypothetical protein